MAHFASLRKMRMGELRIHLGGNSSGPVIAKRGWQVRLRGSYTTNPLPGSFHRPEGGVYRNLFFSFFRFNIGVPSAAEGLAENAAVCFVKVSVHELNASHRRSSL